MKRIILVRHATAEARSEDKDDFDRRLRKKGKREAQLMARWFNRVFTPSILISSPADRAAETARIFAGEIGYPAKKIVTKKKLYGGLEPTGYLKVLKNLDDGVDSVVLFGHNPELTELARFLAPDFVQELPKSSILSLEVRRRYWRTLRPGDARVEVFEHPAGVAERKRATLELRGEIADRIAESVNAVLADLGLPTTEEHLRKIQRASEKLAVLFDDEDRRESSSARSARKPKDKHE